MDELLLVIGPDPRRDTPEERDRLAAIWAAFGADLLTDRRASWPWAMQTFGRPR
jgi:hypothetical protein